MSSYNRTIILGNLTRDPELRYLPNGKPLAKFSIATNRNWTSESGEKKEEVTFIDCDCFGKTAENLSKYCRKGSALLVEGRLKLDQWDDKTTGAKRSKLGVLAETVTFMGGRKQDVPDEPTPADSPASEAAKVDDGQEIPF